MEPITFETEDGLKLEGEMRLPDGPPRASAVICHPHPQFGGSKDHPLLWAIRIELANKGFAVLSFNFRGVMGSEGSFGGGIGEVIDARAAVGRARQEANGKTFVCGWSFGANVALREALEDERVAALALVAMPLADTSLPQPDPERLRAYDRPVLLVAGDGDQYCPVPELLTLAGRLSSSAVEIVAGADHYFGRREREPAELVASFAAERVLTGSSGSDPGPQRASGTAGRGEAPSAPGGPASR
jgi:alpha/beta superfamily hydrolase